MSEPTLQQEIEALRPATEGTLQQLVSVYIDSAAILASAQAMMESVEIIFADTEASMGDLVTAINAAKVAMESAKTAWDELLTEEGADLNG
jgi:hypothetical protein